MKTTSRCVSSKQQAADIIPTTQVAARGAPEEQCTLANIVLTAE
jgi:hypothetical protein